MDSDPRTWIAALRNSHSRLAALVGSLGPDRLNGPSYCGGWTIAQVLSHLGSGAEIAQMTLTAALTPSGTVDREAYPPIWDAWNAKSPAQQAADWLTADEAHIGRLEGLSDTELASVSLEFFSMHLDAVGLIRLRLGEHALHTWDVAVALDPDAVVSPDAVTLLTPFLPVMAMWAAHASGEEFRVRLRGDHPDADFLLEAADKVTLVPWPAGSAAGAGDTDEIAMPAETLLRLVYGRLDPARAPSVDVKGDVGLDQAIAVFPGI
jgi:uncharacterized protein (TIGR03083 family)